MMKTRLLSAIGAVALASSALTAQTIDSTMIAGLRWRNVGPANMSGRIADIEGIPSPSRTFFVAAAAGGVWKSTNGGVTYRPVFDNYGSHHSAISPLHRATPTRSTSAPANRTRATRSPRVAACSSRSMVA